MYYYVVVSQTQTRSIGIAVLAGALAAGAAAFAAVRSGGTEEEVPEAAPEAPDPVPAPAAGIAPNPVPAPALRKESAAPARHPRFFDMYYVFTPVAPARVTAYPLASPPGIVIDLEGVPEPEEPPSALVGEDDRIRSVRRRVTERGLRYIIGIETPVTRIEIEHEGEVVIVTPIR
jgi:hypothetical protein